MPGWLHFNIQRQPPISLMIRDGVLHYAYQKGKNKELVTGQCRWPDGLNESDCGHILRSNKRIYCIIPPEEVRIIHLEKPEGVRKKSLLRHYARIELLNYVDVPIDDILVRLLDSCSLDDIYLTAQVTFKSRVQEHVQELAKHGIHVNRVRLPDGGFSNALKEDECVVLALDEQAPRIIRYSSGNLQHIQPLPRANLSSKQGLCPVLSQSILQWVQRYSMKKEKANIFVLAESETVTKRWLGHLKEKINDPNVSWKTYSTIHNSSEDFSTLWLSLAIKQQKEKGYISTFEVYSSLKENMASTLSKYFCYAFLVFSFLFTSIHLVLKTKTLHDLQHETASTKAHNDEIISSLGGDRPSVLGRYSSKLDKNNSCILSVLNLLGSRHFTELWLNDIIVTKKEMHLIGSSPSLSEFKSYSHWLNASNLISGIKVNHLQPEKVDNSNLISAIKDTDSEIETQNKQLLKATNMQDPEILERLADLKSRKQALSLELQKNKNKRLLFDITLSIKGGST